MNNTPGRDADLGPAHHHFGKIRMIVARELAWADDQVAPIPYTITPEAHVCLHEVAWDLNTYADHLANLKAGHYELR